MVRWGMVVDLRKCVGCQTCSISCKLENALPSDVFWRYTLDYEVNEYPSVKRNFLPMQCMHCNNPACLEVCPTTATKQRDDGIVYVDYDICMGCGYCVVACPYRARHIIKKQKGYFGDKLTPQEKKTYINRDGVTTKCTFCMHKVDYGLANNQKPGIDPDATPSCVNACIANAIHFGDLEDQNSSVNQLIREHKTFKLLDELGTEASVYYIIG